MSGPSLDGKLLKIVAEKSKTEFSAKDVEKLRTKVRARLREEPFFRMATRIKIAPLSLAIFAANFAKSRRRVIRQLMDADI